MRRHSFFSVPEFAVTFLLPGVMLSSTATAQTAASEIDAQTPLEEVIVTGTRVANRSRLDSLSPIDLLSERTLNSHGTTELAQSLATVAPSLNFPRPAATDGTDSIRPATLRGLSPDQTLVLVDSKRRHASALVNLNGSVGRGAAAVDLNAIPLAAIDRIEVLRDGASAQYGSDAIAGVLNLHLREARDGGQATLSVGKYDTQVDTARGSRHENDGETWTASAWQGLALGTQGFLTLTGEYRDRQPTSRGDYDVRAPLTAPTITSRYGDPRSIDRTFYANSGIPIASDWQLYAWVGIQDRNTNSAALPRLANNANNVSATYPNGFLPLITTQVKDGTAAVGARGALAGWDADVSVVYGQNRLQYGVQNTLNSTYGAASPTRFDAGTLVYDQWVGNFGLVHGFDWGLVDPVNVALGAEVREEGYEIRAGEPASYNRGPITTASLSPGAQGFPGLQPSNQINKSRNAYGVYADLDAHLTDKLSGDLAARAERYSDFGSTINGKLSARYEFAPAFAVRGTASTGFRAPSLQQQYFTSTATVFTNGVPFETGTFPATSAVARALGAQDLQAEKSDNYSLGSVFHFNGFEATLDAYQINIRNRIVLSENLSGTAVATLLAPYNVTQARFFINGVGTRTRGVDAVLRYLLAGDAAGKFDFTLAANFNSTDITKVPTNTSTLGNVVLFSRQNQLRYEEGTPQNKFVIGVDWTHTVRIGNVGAALTATRYGKTVGPGTAADGSLDLTIDPAWVVDLSIRTEFHNHVEIAIGADNLLDEYPTRVPVALNSTGAVGFSQFSPFGFNGRYIYARVAYKW